MTPAADRPHVLLEDGSLALEAPGALIPLVERWLPLLPYARRTPAEGAARLRLRAGAPRVPAPRATPTLRLGSVSAWVTGDRVTLRGDAGGAGRIQLRRGAGVMGVPAAGGDPAELAWDVYSMTTLAVALLLARAGRALVHAAAPVSPAGEAWLLAGDTHAGKSTTCANLIAAGWRFASDDHVVLGRGEDGRLWVEGLPRKFHLDDGWGSDGPVGRRGETDPLASWPNRWVARAPLGGVLLPRVAPESPTRGTRATQADALAALIRQSPWLMADRVAAPGILGVLHQAAAGPAFHLRLGLDTFAAPDRLAGMVGTLAGG